MNMPKEELTLYIVDWKLAYLQQHLLMELNSYRGGYRWKNVSHLKIRKNLDGRLK